MKRHFQCMKLEPASLDDGVFLNNDDQRGTLLHQVNIQKIFLTVGPQQQFKIVALHFDISPCVSVKAVAAQHLPAQQVSKLCRAQRDRK